MIKQITVENFYNFKDPLTIDFTTNEKGKSAYRFNEEYISNLSLLYGKNNVGKSNYLKLLFEISKFVNKESYHLERYKPQVKKESSFEIILENEDGELRYGFSLDLDDNRIADEWLFYQGPNEKEEALFLDRKETFVKDDIVSFNNVENHELLVQKEVPNKYIERVQEFFVSLTILEDSESVRGEDVHDLYHTLKNFSDEKKDLINLFLRVSDLEIDKFFLSDNYEINFVHKSSEVFKFQELSSGTQDLLMKVVHLVLIMDEERFLLIDEIEKGLHPDLCDLLMSFIRYLVKCNPELQVLITTHQENLLDLDYISNENKIFLNLEEDDVITVKYLSQFKLNPLHQVSQRYRLNAFKTNPSLNHEYDLMAYFLNRDNDEE